MAQKLMLHSENRIIRQHLSNVCPYMIYVGLYYSMTFDPSNTLHWSGVLPTKFGGHRAFLSKLTLPDPS